MLTATRKLPRGNCHVETAEISEVEQLIQVLIAQLKMKLN